MATPTIHARDIVFTRHGARRGFAWLKEAYAMLIRTRGSWLLLIAAYYGLLWLVGKVPIIGQLGLPIVKPVFAVGFLAAAWAQERGGTPRLTHLFQGFRSNLLALLPLGAFYLVGVTAAVMLTPLVDGGKLLDVFSGRAPLTEELIAGGELQKSMLFAAVCALPTILALWFAPGLVVFQDANAMAALGASLRAAIGNWRPLLVYAMTVFFFGGLVPGVASALVAALLPQQTANIIILMVTVPYLFLFVATLHISDYISYRDVFHAGETIEPLEEAPKA